MSKYLTSRERPLSGRHFLTGSLQFAGPNMCKVLGIGVFPASPRKFLLAKSAKGRKESLISLAELGPLLLTRSMS